VIIEDWAEVAPYAGVYGLSFMFMISAAALALAIMRRRRIEMAWVLILLVLPLFPKMPAASAPRQSALLIQPDISETEEWTAESLEKSIQRQVQLTIGGVARSRQNPPSIIAWPEVPQPLYYDEDPHFRGYANTLAEAANAHLLIGVVAHTASGAPLNSAALISPRGELVSRYDKVNLVPFGEYVPWPFGFAEKISTEVGDFAPGNRVVVSSVGAGNIGAFICYESVFPNFVRRFANQGAGALFNISNDGWFGKTAARFQHLSIVRMRAAENRRWILRSTNDGITTAVDPAGRIRATAPLYTEAALPVRFDFITQKTLYTRWGDWFPLLCAMLTVLCLVACRVVGPARVR
jgi:apolipoprotein N-acyltransferase